MIICPGCKMTYNGTEVECRICGERLPSKKKFFDVSFSKKQIRQLAIFLSVIAVSTIGLAWCGSVLKDARLESERWKEIERAAEARREDPETPIRIGDSFGKLRARCGVPKDFRSYENVNGKFVVLEYDAEGFRRAGREIRWDCVGNFGLTNFKISTISQF